MFMRREGSEEWCSLGGRGLRSGVHGEGGVWRSGVHGEGGVGDVHEEGGVGGVVFMREGSEEWCSWGRGLEEWCS